jgi:hypothetical protein
LMIAQRNPELSSFLIELDELARSLGLEGQAKLIAAYGRQLGEELLEVTLRFGGPPYEPKLARADTFICRIIDGVYCLRGDTALHFDVNPYALQLNELGCFEGAFQSLKVPRPQ